MRNNSLVFSLSLLVWLGSCVNFSCSHLSLERIVLSLKVRCLDTVKHFWLLKSGLLLCFSARVLALHPSLF